MGKWGDPSDLQTYEGGRTYDDLETFATENLKPVCSPKNIDLCDDDKKAEEAEAEFKAEVEKLQARYTALSEEKDEKVAAVKASGLGLMKAVKGSKPAAGNDEL